MGANTWQYFGATSDHIIPDPGNEGTISIGDRIIAICELDDTNVSDARFIAAPMIEGQQLMLHKRVHTGTTIHVVFPVGFDSASHTISSFDALDDLGAWLSVRTGSIFKWWLIHNVGLSLV
jgi:hypothetical protein